MLNKLLDSLNTLWLQFNPWDSDIRRNTQGFMDGRNGLPCARPNDALYDEGWLRGAKAHKDELLRKRRAGVNLLHEMYPDKF